MPTVTLVYPYFRPQYDTSIFRFPPLGLGYIAAYLKQNGVSVEIVDCTFLTQKQALKKIVESKPKVIGIQSMYSMKEKSLELAKLLRHNCELLVAGGALPTLSPDEFLDAFDVVVVGEGEVTMLELVNKFLKHENLSSINGIVYRENGSAVKTASRDLQNNLDQLPFPSRELFENSPYMAYYYKKFGYKTTPLMTSRGCPFNCDFCSKPVFGDSVRMRSAEYIVREIREIMRLGYDRLWIADDCFTLNRQRLMEICEGIIEGNLRIDWECLSRVDTLDLEILTKMKNAGCVRIFFGIESGNDAILNLMNKKITIKQASDAVKLCRQVGVKTGAFFILGYPGENAATILETIKFASSLSLDYLSFTLPYPIPGTPLFERLNGSSVSTNWEEPKSLQLIKHKLLFASKVSERKLKFAIVKGMIQFHIRKHLGNRGYRLFGVPFEELTDLFYKTLP
ncbi:MAG: B12-binding domain-containing radical SAM protein [Betaproteobacteria bacterium]